jgi:hypothetical protein
MFYISSKKGKKYGITDTSDGIEEFYTPNEILQIECQHIKIEGLLRSNGKIYFVPLATNILPLLNTQIGTPVIVQMTATITPKQTIYLGSQLNNDMLVFYFFDDSGLSGDFGISSDFACRHKDFKLKFNDNDPLKVQQLLQRLKG